MARAAVLGRLTWRLGTVIELVDETPRARSIVLDVPDWPGHRAGQHVDVRLTAEDGYQAQRSYSIASAPEDGELVLTVERLEDGEVSSYLVEELRPGDSLELRGPVGGFFVWEASLRRAVAPRGGRVGCRSVPVDRAPPPRGRQRCAAPPPLLRAHPRRCALPRRARPTGGVPTTVDVRFTLTREWPDGWSGYRGRIDRDLLAEVAWPADERPLVYVCGPTAFVETAASSLVELGHDPGRIRTERFGPTGGPS